MGSRGLLEGTPWLEVELVTPQDKQNLLNGQRPMLRLAKKKEWSNRIIDCKKEESNRACLYHYLFQHVILKRFTQKGHSKSSKHKLPHNPPRIEPCPSWTVGRP
jgi:hypothetical protein